MREVFEINKLYFGLDIGGTKCVIVVGNEKGNILHREMFKSGRDIPPIKIINKYLKIVERLKVKFQNSFTKFVGIGISCGGPLDSKNGIIVSPPNLPLWDNINIIDIFEKHTGLKTKIQNDANACALAEWKFGNGVGTKNMVFLTFGTGLGAGIIINEKLYEGTNGMAGEVGHIRLTEDGPCGFNKNGSFEGYCSGGGIKNLAQIIVKEKWNKKENVRMVDTSEGLDNITAKDVFEYANNGDRTALEIVEKCATNLGKGLSIIIDILNPECIVIGSIYTRCENLLCDKALQVIKEESLQLSREACTIKPSKLGDSIGDYASLTVAMV
jgi:glucokinase